MQDENNSLQKRIDNENLSLCLGFTGARTQDEMFIHRTTDYSYVARFLKQREY